MATRITMVPGEFYHCYNRSVEKIEIFKSPKDYQRFLGLMYLCNGTRNIRISDMMEWNFEKTLVDTVLDRGEPLVDICAYSLMPTHPHFIIREIVEQGTARFMQKVFTGYTLYFNKKYGRIGSLFVGTFKSKHISDDRYLKQVVPYVLFNPVELFEPKWKAGKGNIELIEKSLREYPYSSLLDFFGEVRLENKIIGGYLKEFYPEQPSIVEMLREAKTFYLEHSPEV